MNLLNGNAKAAEELASYPEKRGPGYKATEECTTTNSSYVLHGHRCVWAEYSNGAKNSTAMVTR